MKYYDYEDYQVYEKNRPVNRRDTKAERRAAKLVAERKVVSETAAVNDVFVAGQERFNRFLDSILGNAVEAQPRPKPAGRSSLALTDNPLPKVKESVFHVALPKEVVSKDRVGLDFRNQLFDIGRKTFDEYVDDGGYTVPEHSRTVIKNVIAFYRFFLLFVDKKIYPVSELKPGVVYNRIEEFAGLLTKEKVNFDNEKKPGTLLYRVMKDFNLPWGSLRLAFYDGKPGFYYADGNKFIYINVVKGKAYGFKKDWVPVYQ